MWGPLYTRSIVALYYVCVLSFEIQLDFYRTSIEPLSNLCRAPIESLLSLAKNWQLLSELREVCGRYGIFLALSCIFIR